MAGEALVQVQQRGLAEVRDVLKRLPEAIQTNVARGATFEIAEETRKDAVRNAPVDEGKLIGNIVTERRPSRRRTVGAGVKVRTEGKADSPKNAFYWRFLEWGTRFIKAMPFLRPAFDKLASNMDAVITRYLPARVERELKRLARRYGFAVTGK